jgi:hypothetical protein
MTRRNATPGRRYSPGAKAKPKGSYKVTYTKKNGERFQRTFTTEAAREAFRASARKKGWSVS